MLLQCYIFGACRIDLDKEGNSLIEISEDGTPKTNNR